MEKLETEASRFDHIKIETVQESFHAASNAAVAVARAAVYGNDVGGSIGPTASTPATPGLEHRNTLIYETQEKYDKCPFPSAMPRCKFLPSDLFLY
jgi:hypothetical protein